MGSFSLFCFNHPNSGEFGRETHPLTFNSFWDTSVKCANTLKQTGVAMAGFVADTGEYPLIMNTKNTKQKENYGLSMSRYYGGNFFDVIKNGCPSARYGKDWIREYPNLRESITYNMWGVGGYNISEGKPVYGLAAMEYIGNGGNGKYWQAVPEAEVKSPSAMIAWGDSFGGEGKLLIDGISPMSRGRITQHNVNMRTRSRVLKRHAGLMNITYVDGHVQGEKIERIFEMRNTLRLWNRDGKDHEDNLK